MRQDAILTVFLAHTQGNKTNEQEFVRSSSGFIVYNRLHLMIIVRGRQIRGNECIITTTIVTHLCTQD